MPNYNAQVNSIKDGKPFGGLGPKEAGKRGGLNKGKKKKEKSTPNEEGKKKEKGEEHPRR